MHAHTEDYTVIMIVSPSKLLLPAEFPLSLIHHLHVEDEPEKCNWNKPQLWQEKVEAYKNSNKQVKMFQEITSSATEILTKDEESEVTSSRAYNSSYQISSKQCAEAESVSATVLNTHTIQSV